MKETQILADLLLDRLRVKGKPDLASIASSLGLKIKEVDSTGFDGALIRGKNVRKGLIAIKKSMLEGARKRFTVAHEIGHFVIPYHQNIESICAEEQVESWRNGLKRAEVEANEFAAELL